jgi:hypothetical protein
MAAMVFAKDMSTPGSFGQEKASPPAGGREETYRKARIRAKRRLTAVTTFATYLFVRIRGLQPAGNTSSARNPPAGAAPSVRLPP